MSERTKRRRRSERRVFFWCLAVAAALHVVAFLVFPGIRPGDAPFPIFGDDLTVEAGAIGLDIFFGPPMISNATGGFSPEPPERVLEADRLVYLEAGCRALIRGSGTVIRGSVRLRVRSNGLADALNVVRSTGEPCGDEVLKRVAGDLWYRWLPNEDFPAPVELIQPVSFAENGTTVLDQRD